jgi:hypothetical protein
MGELVKGGSHEERKLKKRAEYANNRTSILAVLYLHPTYGKSEILKTYRKCI